MIADNGPGAIEIDLNGLSVLIDPSRVAMQFNRDLISFSGRVDSVMIGRHF